MDSRWVVATTRSGRESWAIENLARQDCPYYFPHVPEIIRTKRKRELRIRPLFSRHIFVQITGDRWRFLLGTWGIQGIIMSGDGPACVPKREIERLKALEDPDGMIVLPKLNAKFDQGQSLKIKDGMFQGYNGIYQGQHSRDREKVLVAFLGRKTTVLIASQYLEAA